jgi:hypothetical protein
VEPGRSRFADPRGASGEWEELKIDARIHAERVEIWGTYEGSQLEPDASSGDSRGQIARGSRIRAEQGERWVGNPQGPPIIGRMAERSHLLD